jgi:hypothetical protein
MIHEFTNPIPCTTPQGDGYIWYVRSNGQWENDEFTVILTHDGSVMHFTSSQIKIWHNETYGIKKHINTI